MKRHRSRFPRVLALALLSPLILGLTATPAVALVEKEVAGRSRFETAVEMSKQGWLPGTESVIITTGTDWPDALGGAVFSRGQMADGPILLVRQDSIPDVVWAEIDRLDPTNAIILGGKSAVGQAVEARLISKLGATHVVRLAGSNRYETSKRIAEYAISMDNDEGSLYDGIAFVATGNDFPDALAAGPVSAHREWPIFLANPAPEGGGTVPAAFMKANGVKEVYILGGPNVVTQAQEDMLEAAFPGEVSRLAGQDRYETGAIVAQFGDDSLLNWAAPSIATGDDFPDALAGGPHAARWLSPLIITPGDQLHPAAAAKLSEHKASVNWVWYLGGTSALSENVRSQVRGVLQ